jgi:glycosyltransferase involved in cell wall biosynthesis
LSGSRAAGVPFVLWSALWGHLSTPAHLLARPLIAAAHRRAAVVVAYGPHVAAHARALGAQRVVLAPQAVDNAFWAARTGVVRDDRFSVLWVGRPAPEKGLDVLREAWSMARLPAGARLRMVGAGAPDGAERPEQLRNSYARSHVVVIPSIASRRFREPWGLVANEAMNQHCAIIATDAVGAAAGGLVRDGVTGLVVPAGDPRALSSALERLAADPALRIGLADRGAQAVAAYTQQAWADGFAEALREATAPGAPC